MRYTGDDGCRDRLRRGTASEPTFGQSTVSPKDRLSDPDASRLAAHFSAIVQNSFDAIVSKDLQGTVQSWNGAAERIFGWSAGEIIGRSIRTIIPADRHAEEDDILARISAGERITKFETVRQHKSGRDVPVAVTISPLTDESGRVVGASKIAHDISEAIEIRSRLEDSERQFRMLANNIPQLAWIADSQGSIFWYNARWFDYTGSTLEEMHGWGWTKVHHPDHVERVKERIQRSWNTGEEWEDTFPLRGRDGEYRWFLSRAKPLFDRDGRVWRWFGTNTDITVQRDNEQQIRMLMGEVNHRAKNMIAVVQALVSRTVDRKYSDSLNNRLLALGRNQDILTKRNWRGAPVGELLASQLTAVEDLLGTRIMLEGELDLPLSPSAAETIGLAIHELTTNATKYGSLSGPEGTVHIRCVVTGSDERTFSIGWEEAGGPPVRQPRKTGFGTVMIDRNPRLALRANVEFGYPPSGFFWRLSAPLEQVVSAEPDLR